MFSRSREIIDRSSRGSSTGTSIAALEAARTSGSREAAAREPTPVIKERRSKSTTRGAAAYCEICGRQPGCQRRVHGTPMPRRIGVLAGKVQGVLDRNAHFVGRIQGAHVDVAVCTSGVFVALPVV